MCSNAPNSIDIGSISGILSEKLNSELYCHSVATQELAVELAERYRVDKQKAALAGLLHDCARGLSHEELFLNAERYQIAVDQIRLAQPGLLHAPVGSKLAQMEFGVKDDEILHAIAVHNTASSGMSGLDKVLYVADASEPNRDYPGVERIRELAFSNDLDGAFLEAMEIKIHYTMKRKSMLHPMSLEAWNEILGSARARSKSSE